MLFFKLDEITSQDLKIVSKNEEHNFIWYNVKLSTVNDFNFYLTSNTLNDDEFLRFLKKFSNDFRVAKEKYIEMNAEKSVNNSYELYADVIKNLVCEYSQFIEQNGIKVDI